MGEMSKECWAADTRCRPVHTDTLACGCSRLAAHVDLPPALTYYYPMHSSELSELAVAMSADVKGTVSAPRHRFLTFYVSGLACIGLPNPCSRSLMNERSDTQVTATRLSPHRFSSQIILIFHEARHWIFSLVHSLGLYIYRFLDRAPMRFPLCTHPPITFVRLGCSPLLLHSFLSLFATLQSTYFKPFTRVDSAFSPLYDHRWLLYTPAPVHRPHGPPNLKGCVH